MSPESILREFLSAGDRGDVEAFDGLLREDVVVHAPFGLSTEGIEREKESWRRAKAAMPDIRHAVQDIVTGEALVAARTVVTGTMQGEYGGLRANDRCFSIDQAVFARIVDGKIAELWEIVDTAALRQQLGGD